jgi:hypothetical protein
MPGTIKKIIEHVHQAKEEAKEKIDPFSQTNKYKRMENRERKEELQKTERESYRKEELHQAAERGKLRVRSRYNPSRSMGAKASRFAEGTSRTGTKLITHGIPKYRGTNDLRVAGGDLSVAFGLRAPSAPKKVQAPAVITTVSKAGTVKIIRPVEKPKEEDPGFFDLGANLRQPTKKGFHKRERQLGDMF